MATNLKCAFIVAILCAVLLICPESVIMVFDTIYTGFCKIFVSALIVFTGVLMKLDSKTVKNIALKLNRTVQYNEIYKEAMNQTIEYAENLYKTEKVTPKFLKKIIKKFMSVSTKLMYKTMVSKISSVVGQSVSQKTGRNFKICINVMSSIGSSKVHDKLVEKIEEERIVIVEQVEVSGKMGEPIDVVEDFYSPVFKPIVDDWENI